MNLKFTALLATLALVSAVNGATTALIDFGRTDNQTSGSPIYNNFAVGATGGAALNVNATFQTASIAINGGTYTNASAALNSTTGATTGWTLSIQGRSQSGTAGQIGTAGAGGDYTGTLGTNTTTIFSTTSTRDGIYINNSAVMRVTISGLDTSKTYDLSAFAGRDGSATADGGYWSLVSGTALTSQAYLNASAVPTAITGATLVDSFGANQGDLVQWIGVTPGAGGVITFDITTQNQQANAIASLNSFSIVEVPEPGSTLLAGLGGLLLLRRRR